MDLSTEALMFYETHPVEFCEDLIDGVVLDQWQKDVLNALVQKKFIAIRSGSGVGKTALLSLASLWFLALKPFSKVPTTAPSQHQLYDLLWSEHAKWIEKSKFLNSMIDWTQTMLHVKAHPARWYAAARTARPSASGDIAEGLQGFHNTDNLLYIIDEGSGIHDSIFPAVEGAFTGENSYAIIAGNPTQNHGYFFNCFNKPEIMKYWTPFHISCYDTPRVTRRYIDMMRDTYGEEHPVFYAKVLGEFPKFLVDYLFPPTYLEAMQNADKVDVSAKTPIEIGLDVGRTSSKSVITVRQGLKILRVDTLKKEDSLTDTVDIVEWASGYIEEYKAKSLKVDSIGIGAGVYDLLLRRHPGIVYPVIGGAGLEKENDRAMYINLRAKGFWELRKLLPTIYCDRWDSKVIQELGLIKHKVTKLGKIQVESKEDFVAAHGFSPDYADSLMYSFLDSGLCVSKFGAISTNVNLAEINAGMLKSSRFAFNSDSQVNKWSIM